MGYCVTADVQRYFMNKTFGASDYVSSDDVTAYIAQQTAYINSLLKRRYSLPITDTEDLSLLQMVNAYLVVGVIDEILREKVEEGQYEYNRNLKKEGKNILTMIVNGEMTLNTASKASVIKFNDVDSQGNTVEKRFRDTEIQPTSEYNDRETHTVIRYS